MTIPKAHVKTAEFVDDYLQGTGLGRRATLDELCALHGIAKEDVYRVLYLKGDDAKDGPSPALNPHDAELFRAIAHPTFLDLPADFKGWRQLLSYNHSLKFGTTKEEGAEDEDDDELDGLEFAEQPLYTQTGGAALDLPEPPPTGYERRVGYVDMSEMGPEHSAYLLYCMPPYQRRQVVAKLLQSIGPEHAEDILDSKKMSDADLRSKLQLAIINFQGVLHQEEDLTTAPESPATYSMVQLISRNKSHFLERSHWNIAKRVAREAAQLERNKLARMAVVGNRDIEVAIELTKSMNAWLEQQGTAQRLHPRQVCDTLFAYGMPEKQDPLLMMNIRRFLDQDTSDNEAHKAIREHLTTMDKQGFHYDQPMLIENLAKQFSSAPLFILSLEQLTKHTGISEQDLFNFVTEPKKSWVPDDGQWKMNPLSTFGKLIAAAKIQDPATLLAQPTEAAPVKAKPVVVKADKPVVVVVKNEWEQAGYPKNLGEQLKGRVNTPKELEAVIEAALALMPEKMRVDATRKLFKAALRQPAFSGGRGDVPSYASLPHVWLMWAMRPETQTLGREQMAYEFTKTFGGDDAAAREASSFTRTAPGALAAWVIEQVRDARGKQAFTSYGDYLKSIDGRDDRTGQHFEQHLAYLARVDANHASQPKDTDHAARLVKITGLTNVALTGILGPIRRGDRVRRAIKNPAPVAAVK